MPSLCLLKVVAARVVAQLFSLTLTWICRCSVSKICLVSSGCSSFLVSSFLLCRSCVAFARSCALACAARLFSFTSFLLFFSCFQSPKIVHWCCGFHDLCVRQITSMSQSEPILHQIAHMGNKGSWEVGLLLLTHYLRECLGHHWSKSLNIILPNTANPT